MSYIILAPQEDELIFTGKQITFIAPCDCSVPEGIKIGEQVFDFVDNLGNSVVGTRGFFVEGAIISAILDVDNSRAYLQGIVDATFVAVDVKDSKQSTLLDSVEAALDIMSVAGKSEQFRTSGKNLLPRMVSNTNNGWTYSVDENGVITVSGTSGTSGTGSVSHINNIVIPKGTYTLSDNCPSPGIRLVSRIVYKKEASDGYDYINAGSTFTIDHDSNEYSEFFYQLGTDESNVTANNIKVYPQLELGSVSTSYEPYTGGIASPNPDYPQEIKSTVISEIKTVGKNLFDKNTDYFRQGHYTLNGFEAMYGGNVYTTTPIFLNAGTYIISQDSSIEYANVIYVKKIKDDGCLDYENILKSTNTFVATENGYYSIQYSITNDFDEDLNNTFQLELGTEATSYESYTESVVTLPEPITLNGILVSSDGNVVDENGKQWISDTIEKNSNGEYEVVRRVAEISDFEYAQTLTNIKQYYSIIGINLVYGNEHNANKSVCNVLTKYSYSQSDVPHYYIYTQQANVYIPIDFEDVDSIRVHALIRPDSYIHEPLSAANQTALRSLKTFNEVTHIFTDSEVKPEISVGYATSKVGAVALNTQRDEYLNMLDIANQLAEKLPLSGGTLNGNLNVRGSDGLALYSDNYPGQITGRNASGTKRYELYTNSTDGSAADVELRVYYNDNHNFHLFRFGKDGSLSINGTEFVRKDMFTVDGDTLILNFL